MMRKLVKVLHTLASSGLIGALLGYGIVLVYAPQETATQYADARKIISALCNYVLLPSMAIALITGLLSMVVHKPYMDRRWAWVKAFLGLSMFEATLGIVQSKANTAAATSAKIASGELPADALQGALTSEWYALGVIMTLSVANVVLGVWRPKLTSFPRMAWRERLAPFRR
jgi:hypothetical protein